MKTKYSTFITSLIVIGATALFAIPAHAGRGSGNGGGGGTAGECPQGLVPGTRNTQDCTRALDGSGTQNRKGSAEKGTGSGNGTGTRQNKRDGSGSGSGNRNGGGNGLGTGDPATCPNNLAQRGMGLDR